MIQPMCFSFNVIAKLFYTILPPIKLQWIFYIAIIEFAVNTPTRWNVLINLTGVWLVGIWAGALCGWSITSKLAYIMNGTLNWFCPL